MPIQDVITFETGKNFPTYLINAVGLTAQLIATNPELLIGLGLAILCAILIGRIIVWLVLRK
jgi:hypothetical protein